MECIISAPKNDSVLMRAYNSFRFILKLHIFCYSQLLCPFVWKRPEHILKPSADQHDQAIAELQMGPLTWRQ